MTEPDIYKIYDKEFNEEMLKNNSDIATAYSRDFFERWSGYRVEVPMQYINFGVIYNLVETEHPGLITKWYEPVNDHSEFEQILGGLSEPFAHYLSVVRKSLTHQYLSLWSGLGYLELTIYDDGQEKYVTSKPREEFTDTINTFLDQLFEAYKNHG